MAAIGATRPLSNIVKRSSAGAISSGARSISSTPELSPSTEIALLDGNRAREALWESKYLKEWGVFANTVWKDWIYSLAEHKALKNYKEAVMNEDTKNIKHYKENFLEVAQLTGTREGVDSDVAQEIGQQIVYLFNGFIMTDIDPDKDLQIGDESMLFWSGLNQNSPVQDGIMKRFGNVGVPYVEVESDAVVPTNTMTAILEFALRFIKNPIVATVWSSFLKGYLTWFLNPGRDNWCYCQVGDVGAESICFTSYAYKDLFKVKSYRTHYVNAEKDTMLNAGNDPSSPFTVSVWCKLKPEGKLKKWKVVKTLNCVFYRDVIRVVKGTSGDLIVVHCKGEHHGAQGGDVEIY